MEAIAHDLKLALDSVAFAVELGFTPDPWQESVLRWTGKRLLMNCSRQSGKSTTAAILGLHRALYHPKSLVLLVSPSLRQSSELFRKVTEFLGNLLVRPKLLEDNKLSCTLDNKSRILSLPSSEATIRGFSGANLIIEDESARVPDGLYKAVRPMLAVSNGKLILMSTPFGKRGHFFEEWTNNQGWEKIEVKATECPRISPEFLEEERRSLGDWWFSQEYMCEFMETLDNLFSYDLINKAVSSDIKPLFGG
jgi:hypothetical protein